MASKNLTAQPRTETGKGAARTSRREGRIPGIIYGHGRDPQPLSLDSREVEKLLGSVTESTVIELALGGKTLRTLVREVQRHPFKRQVLHVDFQELVAGEHIIVNIPLRFVGIAEGVRVGGGIMDTTLRELECEVDPSSIPDHIDVDITDLGIGHPLHVRDLTLPPSILKVLDDEDASIVVVAPPRMETPVAGVEVIAAPAEPEVIRKAKADDDE